MMELSSIMYYIVILDNVHSFFGGYHFGWLLLSIVVILAYNVLGYVQAENMYGVDSARAGQKARNNTSVLSIGACLAFYILAPMSVVKLPTTPQASFMYLSSISKEQMDRLPEDTVKHLKVQSRIYTERLNDTEAITIANEELNSMLSDIRAKEEVLTQRAQEVLKRERVLGIQ